MLVISVPLYMILYRATYLSFQAHESILTCMDRLDFWLEIDVGSIKNSGV